MGRGIIKQTIEVPEWAHFFSPEEFRVFLTYIWNYFESKEMKISVSDGVLQIEKDQKSLGTFGLLNLAQVCKTLPENEWENTVEFHFDTLIKHYNERVKSDDAEYLFTDIADFLTLRIWKKESLKGLSKELVNS